MKKLNKLYHSSPPQTSLFITDDPGTNYPLNTCKSHLMSACCSHRVSLGLTQLAVTVNAVQDRDIMDSQSEASVAGMSSSNVNYFMITAIRPACCIRWSHLTDVQ